MMNIIMVTFFLLNTVVATKMITIFAVIIIDIIRSAV